MNEEVAETDGAGSWLAGQLASIVADRDGGERRGECGLALIAVSREYRVLCTPYSIPIEGV